MAQALTAAGYVVAASDHRGHGPKCPPADLGFFADSDGWRACLTDLEAVAHQLRRDYPGLPMAFMGHSMGSFMGQTYIAEHGAELAAAVLSGTSGPPPAILGIGRRLAAFERWRLGPRGRSKLVAALLFGELNKPFKPARTPFDWLSRDNAEVDKYIADPLCGFDSTNQLAIDLLGALADLASPATAARIPKGLPIYIFSGSRDPVGAKLQGADRRLSRRRTERDDEDLSRRAPRDAQRDQPRRGHGGSRRVAGRERALNGAQPLNCASTPAMSPMPQCSAMRPSRTRKMSQEVKRNGRPVGATP